MSRLGPLSLSLLCAIDNDSAARTCPSLKPKPITGR